jgi:hypothetical protein
MPWGGNYAGSFPQTVDFSGAGIASGEAFGSLTILLGNEILPASIASGEAWGTPTLAGPILATSIPSGEAWGTAALGLTVFPAAIASAEAWGTPKLSLKIFPASIASGEAWGSLTATETGPVVHASSIASAEAWGAPTLAGPLLVQGIPSLLAFGLPGAAGPLTVVGIASAEAWGAPTLNVIQNVDLAGQGIASAEAWGTPQVHLVISVNPDGIPSSEAWGSPTLASGKQRIFAASILSGEAWGYPAIAGGFAYPSGLAMFIGGYDRSGDLRMKINAASSRSQTLGRATLQFDLVDKTGAHSYTPQIGQTCLVMDFGRRVFAGCLSDVVAELQPQSAAVIYHCTALDKSSICDRRVVFATYPAGADAYATVLEIVGGFLNGEGITVNGVAPDLGTLTSDLICNGQTVRQVFDSLATDVGGIWWVTMDSDLGFTGNLVSPPCPFEFFDGSANWRKLTVEQTLLNYRNKQWAVSDRNTVPTSGGTENVALTETYTLPQPAAQAAGFQLGALVLQMNWSQIVSITVNGTPVNFVDMGTGGAQYNIGGVYWGFPGSPYIYPPNAANNDPDFPDPPGGTDPAPNPGDVLVVSYISTVQTAAVTEQAALAPSDPNLGGGNGTCGSGVYEAVEQVKGITTISDLNAIAQAVLNKLGGIPTILKAETDQPGAAVGQTLHVDLPSCNAPDMDLIITEVDWVHNPVDLGKGSALRWSITAMAPADIGNWVGWFEDLVGRTQNAPPLDRFETASFVLAPGSSLAAGLVATNPYIVKHTGKPAQVVIAATTPPVGQDLVLDITVGMGGPSIFNPGQQPVLPAGSTQVVIVNPAAFALAYLYKNQVLFPTAAYRVVSSGSTAQASGVSMDAEWTY